MNKSLLLFIFSLLLSSCATVLLDSTHVVNIQSDLPNSKVKMNDNIYSLPANVELKRSKVDLNLTLISDSKEIPFKAKPKLTGTFKYANLLGVYLNGFGVALTYLTDLTNDKRFYYGKSLWLNSTAKDSSVTVLKEKDNRYKYIDSLSYYKHYSYKKGDVRINASIPFFNLFGLRSGNQQLAHVSTLGGLSFGAEYFHRKNQFINATYTKIINDDIGGFFRLLFSGVYQEINSDYFSITNNHVSDRLSIGYGLSYGHNHYSRTNMFDKSDSFDKRYNVFGLSFPMYYQAGRNLHLGFVYNPSFYRVNQSNQWKYEYLFSFDLAWKIKL